MRMMAVLFIPFIAVEFLYAANGARKEKRIIHTLLRQKGLIFAVALLLVTALGMMVLKVYNHYDEMMISPPLSVNSGASILETSYHTLLYSVFALLCIPMGGIDMANITGLAEAALRVFIYVSCVGMVAYLMKNRKRHQLKAVFAADYLSASFIVTFCVVVVFGVNAPRYFYFLWYLVAFAVACLVDSKCVKSTICRRFFAGVIAALCVLPIYKYDLYDIKEYKDRSAETVTYNRIAQYLVENEFEGVYAVFEHSVIIAAYSDMKLDAGYLLSHPTSLHSYVWCADKRVYYDNDRGKYALVFSDEELGIFESGAPWYHRDFMETQAVLVERIGVFNIFETGLNPLSAFRVPILRGESSDYVFSKNYAAKAEGVLVSYTENYVESALQHDMLWGSYFNMRKGMYELTVNYEYLDENSAAEFKVAAGGSVLTEMPLPRGVKSAVVMLELPEDIKNVEFRVTNSSGNIRMYSVNVTKVK